MGAVLGAQEEHRHYEGIHVDDEVVVQLVRPEVTACMQQGSAHIGSTEQLMSVHVRNEVHVRNTWLACLTGVSLGNKCKMGWDDAHGQTCFICYKQGCLTASGACVPVQQQATDTGGKQQKGCGA